MPDTQPGYTVAKQGAQSLLDEHLRHCVTEAARADDKAATGYRTEASKAIARLVRL